MRSPRPKLYKKITIVKKIGLHAPLSSPSPICKILYISYISLLAIYLSPHSQSISLLAHCSCSQRRKRQENHHDAEKLQS